MKTFIIAIISMLSVFTTARELVVYTSRKEHLVKNIFKAYEKETGIHISYKTGKAGALIQGLKAEGKQTKADVFMSVDAGNLWYASNEGLLAPLNSSGLIKNIPSHLRDPKNRWFGLSVRARTTVVNTKKVDTDKVKITYEGLAKKEWKGRLCLRTSKKVYNQSLVAMLISMHGEDKAKQIVKGWVNNTVDIFSNDTAVLKAVAAGQCDVGIVNTYYFGRLIRKDPKLPLKIVWPNQNDYGVHINISGAGVVKNSTQKKEAQRFIEWLSEESAQKEFAQVNMEYPVLKGSPQSHEVKSWGSFKGNSKFNLAKAGELQKRAIKLMHEVGYK